MGFPDDEDLDVRVEAAFGADLTDAPATWTWTDLSDRLLPQPVTASWGTAAGAATAQVSRGTLTLSNEDGALTPHRAASPYWPYVDAGTPMRVSINPNRFSYTDTFTRTVSGGWGTSSSGHAWTVLANTANFAVNGTAATVQSTARNSTLAALLGYPSAFPRNVDATFDVAVSAVALTTANIVGCYARYYDVNNWVWATVEFGLSGQVQLKVRVAHTTAITDLAQATVPGMTYTAGTMVRCRVQVTDDRVRMRAWLPADPEPDTWLIDTYNGYRTGVGYFGMRAYVFPSNTNTLPVTFTVDNLTVVEAPATRIEGYIADVRPTFLPEGGGKTYSTVTVDVGGVGSRLEKNEAPALSPLRRSVQLSDPPPVAYWPLEDAEGSTSGVSAFPEQPRMTVTGPAVFGFGQGTPDDVYQTRYGTKPMVSVAAGARLDAIVHPSTVQNEWAVSFVGQFLVPDVPAVTEVRILQWETTGGTYNRWAFVGTDTGHEVRAYNDLAGTTTVAAVNTNLFVGQISYTIEAIQNGANIDVTMFFNDNGLGTGSVAGTLAAVTRVTVNPDRANTTASLTPAGLRFIIGHVRVVDETSLRDLPHYTDPDNGVVVHAANAWHGESAHGRLARLCAEERVPFLLLADPGADGLTRVGAQRDGSFTDLVAQAVESESGGLLYERGFGYAYLPRAARYNRTPHMVIDMATYARSIDTAATDVLVPQLDARAANYWTITRAGGSSGSYAAPLAHRQRRGTIAEERTLDVLTDTDPAQHAAWRTHLNVDAQGADYPSIPVDLAANPALIDSWLRCNIGSRVQRTNQPTVAGYGTIDQVIAGISEQFGPRSWSATANGSPAKVWDVAVVDDLVLGKADTDGSVLASSATAGATTLSVNVTDGPRWTTDPAQMPILVTAAGEDLRITAIAGTSNPQTFTVVRALNGVSKALPAGTPIGLTNPARVAL